MVDAFCAESLLGKARDNGLLDLRTHDLRQHTTDVHRTVDDAPFGGGAGMVMKAEPIFASVEAADPMRPLFLLGPGGRRFDQKMAAELGSLGGFGLLCGRYEGVDHRVGYAEVPEGCDGRCGGWIHAERAYTATDQGHGSAPQR